jgi:hypothetical protein
MTLPGVSVALPVHRDSGTLEDAVRCLQAQTHTDLDVVMVLNGSDEGTRRKAHGLAREDGRIRTIELPEANLAAACNAGLEAARHELVARMDADDLCVPRRLEVQARFMAGHPEVAAVGSAWELLGPDDEVISTVRPPTEPGALRWRLLIGNVLAHGSMMLRRGAVLRAGGYDTRCSRAQDYELWLRLSRAWDLASVPEVLYQHRTAFAEDPGRSSRAQADVAGPAMVNAWRELPAADESQLALLTSALQRALSREGRPDGQAIEQVLSTCPTREGLLAWLWREWFTPPLPRRAMEVCRRARLREVGASLRGAGVREVWLWGAGEHTRWVLEHRAELGVRIAGIVDDGVAGEERFGSAVRAPETLHAGTCVLLSSDWHEEAMWDRSGFLRQRGVQVMRMYGSAEG